MFVDYRKGLIPLQCFSVYCLEEEIFFKHIFTTNAYATPPPSSDQDCDRQGEVVVVAETAGLGHPRTAPHSLWGVQVDTLRGSGEENMQTKLGQTTQILLVFGVKHH